MTRERARMTAMLGRREPARFMVVAEKEERAWRAIQDRSGVQ